MGQRVTSRVQPSSGRRAITHARYGRSGRFRRDPSGPTRDVPMRSNDVLGRHSGRCRCTTRSPSNSRRVEKPELGAPTSRLPRSRGEPVARRRTTSPRVRWTGSTGGAAGRCTAMRAFEQSRVLDTVSSGLRRCLPASHSLHPGADGVDLVAARGGPGAGVAGPQRFAGPGVHGESRAVQAFAIAARRFRVSRPPPKHERVARGASAAVLGETVTESR